ncbi:hypothetical protein DPEC_G00183360 [Dallia pectoralis]|uniref:Uncharacterized protein n=1 Tax=Dallia pectoralis TaxID=75939 RepID=A0ACC2GB79_DALPE|nr:hypothetical protein DPEC_G00183360 [Dallia pectoralis]
MSATNNSDEHVNKLQHQISVMRKEIKNLRQLLDSGVRSHRKQMTSLQSALTQVGQDGVPQSQPMAQTQRCASNLLEKGTIQTVPIGYISSCFSVKTGTPRQPTICGPSRATLQIQQSVFNNPGHSLVGLENYSHVWVVFLFHKNGHLSYKAKVMPPRLNGQKVGVFSTRSPHRPNALGLTLAKLDRVAGDTLHLSEVDMIAGTPVLDIKPYIPDYDSPQHRPNMHTNTDCRLQPEGTECAESVCSEDPSPSTEDAQLPMLVVGMDGGHSQSAEPRLLTWTDTSKVPILSSDDTSSSSAPKVLGKGLSTVLAELNAFLSQGDDHLSGWSSAKKFPASDGHKAKPLKQEEDVARPCYGEEAYSTIAGWIREPPVTSLEVRFTPHAERDLGEFLGPSSADSLGCNQPRFQFLRCPKEAASAIRGILAADPRSVYRRSRCKDRLFFFTLDTADITCWFGPGFAEVLQVRPVAV